MTYHLQVIFALACLAGYVIISKLTVFLHARQFARSNGCKPPLEIPQRETIIGYELMQKQRQNAKLKRNLFNGYNRFEQFGDTFSLTISATHFIATRDPENVKTILSTNFKDYGLGMRLRAFGPLLGSGIFTTDGAHWEHSRALIRPNFSKSQVADLDTFEDHVQYMIAKIPRDGSTIDLQKLFYQLTLDSATEFLFGESVDILRKPEGSEEQLFADAFDYAQTQLIKRNRMGPLMFLYRNKKFDQACKRVHRFVDNYVNKARAFRCSEEAKKGTERYTFLNELAKSTDNPQELRDELLNILLAGRDTTAGLLSNTFHVLARRPDIWQKLVAEVETLNNEMPTYETLRGMTYLKYVLNEGLRLFPSVAGNARFANKNTVLPRGGGLDGESPVFVAKGQMVTYSAFSMHRRKDVYGDDALEFKPERWETLRPGWAYLPFNGGPRICVGQQFALTEASYTIVRLIQQFSAIEPRDDLPWCEMMALTLSSGTGTMVAMTPRETVKA